MQQFHHSNLALLIRQEREARGLTQRQIAERLGEQQSFVARIEGGGRRIEVMMFFVLAKAIGFNPMLVLGRLWRRSLRAKKE